MLSHDCSMGYKHVSPKKNNWRRLKFVGSKSWGLWSKGDGKESQTTPRTRIIGSSIPIKTSLSHWDHPIMEPQVFRTCVPRKQRLNHQKDDVCLASAAVLQRSFKEDCRRCRNWTKPASEDDPIPNNLPEVFWAIPRPRSSSMKFDLIEESTSNK